MPRALPNGEFVNSIESIVTAEYLGEQTLTGNGASQAATLPDDTNSVLVYAEGGAVYVAVNAAASAGSGIYIPDGGFGFIGAYLNLTSLAVFATAPAKAHLVYEKQ